MPEAALVPKFLKAVAAEHGFSIHDCLYGSIHIGRERPIEQASAAVYGIWAKSPTPPRIGLSPLPDYEDWYPVYWGKDISPVSRLKAHVQGHKNGNINLPGLSQVQGLPLVFGAVLVTEYRRFESLLHTKYPPLRGSPNVGRQASVVMVRGET